MAPNARVSTRHRASTLDARKRNYEQAVAVMGQRLGEADLRLADVASAVGVSSRQLQRCFLGHDDSFRRRLQELRMERALHLFRQRVPLKRVARLVGYKHATHFCTAFRRHFDAPVGDVRAALRIYSPAPRRGERRIVHSRRGAWSKRQQRVHAVARELRKRGVIGSRPPARRRAI